MPVETLQADRMVRQVSSSATFTSAMPFRILNKGPEYFRRPPEPSSKKPSAVERLEADKAKYVKSQQVVCTRQEPVKPPVIKKPLTPALLQNTPTRKAPLALRRGEGRRNVLNVDILNNLINICDSPLSSPKLVPDGPAVTRPQTPKWEKQISADKPTGYSKLSDSCSTLCKNAPSSVTVRRVDVKPLVTQQPKQKTLGFISPPPPSPAITRISSTSSRSSRKGTAESGRKQPSLHRSKSDLSDRYSRATADLERFFNYCGLDPQEIEHIGVEHFVRASSDIVSNKFPSVSTPSSECGQSQQSNHTEEKSNERVPYGISIIERNARVIKWLYGIRQARETQKVSNV
ncbi:LOW QUALITY PROTEIN: protein FAM110A [Polypterus senegalus]|uniref:LOW QUALITY PROTEIN: protein FAM110A n=1 Tax=Polypterus senegalus TaxID=55291 RepID=UPI001963A225|nr:LOW QUALITY PROTEIN: protein FAM110A [Polypterus senegalus]